MKSEIKRLWPVEDGELIYQYHKNFDSYNWSNDQRLEALARDEEIRRDTERLWKENGHIVVGSRKNPYLISEIELSFTDAEWVDVAQIDGELLPSCCANISEVRNCLLSALIHNKLIDVEDLEESTRLYREHIIEDDLDTNNVMKAKFIGLWDKIKPYADFSKEKARVYDMKNLTPKEACSLISKHCTIIDYNFIFNKSSPEQEFESDVVVTSSILKLIPALKVLYDKIGALAKDFEGFAIFSEEEKNNCGIVETFRSLAIYAKVETAMELAERFAEMYKKPFEVKKVKMSLEKGIEVGESIKEVKHQI